MVVAARNEQDLIGQCLQNLEQLDYPKPKIQIWIVNDNSDDKTESIVLEYIKSRKLGNFYLCNAPIPPPHANGKAMALDFALKQIQAEFYLFTDADCSVPDSWARRMVTEFVAKPNVGIITATTSLVCNSIFASLQAIDWLMNLSLLRLVSHFDIGLTAAGNNMAIRSESYKKVPGFGQAAWHLTEDYIIFNQLIKKNIGFSQLFDTETLVISRPAPTLSAWLSQRSRWMEGALALPILTQLGALMPVFFYLFMLILAVFYSFKLAMIITITKILAQTLIFGYFIGIGLKQKHLISWILVYDFYALTLNTIAFFYKIFNKKTQWKGRIYGKNNLVDKDIKVK